jgi:hypothetical protein
VIELILGLYTAAMAHWAWPGVVESARCRRLWGCLECTWLVPCDRALRQVCTALPRAKARSFRKVKAPSAAQTS